MEEEREQGIRIKKRGDEKWKKKTHNRLDRAKDKESRDERKEGEKSKKMMGEEATER